MNAQSHLPVIPIDVELVSDRNPIVDNDFHKGATLVSLPWADLTAHSLLMGGETHELRAV